MSVVPEIGKCYDLTGRKTGWGSEVVNPPKYLGKYIGSEQQGPPYDRYTILKFQNDNNVDPGGQFRVTTCKAEPEGGRKTRTRKTKRRARKTRRLTHKRKHKRV